MIAIRRPLVLPLSMLACAVLGASCSSRDRSNAASGTTSTRAVTAATFSTSTAGDVSSPGQQSPVHDPAHPPIDCPLRKRGLDPAHLRPFEDTAKYIAFLERPDRAAWQKPDAVVAALGLTGKETVIDIGAQDSKIIHLDDHGFRTSFRMNRKCAAGTGAFLEEIAYRLDLSLSDLNGLAERSTKESDVIVCTVFDSIVRSGDKVEIRGFGNFHARRRRGRIGRYDQQEADRPRRKG